MDVYFSIRVCIRFRVVCEKLKKVLSVNSEVFFYIECLMDEKDVKGFIRRDEFERFLLSFLDRIFSLC